MAVLLSELKIPAPVVIDLLAGLNRPKKLIKPTSITIHDTGNVKPGADALNHAAYLKSAVPNTIGQRVSWHITVDDKRIVQHIPLNEEAFHAGDGENGPGNLTSIGIEICEHQGCQRTAAELNAVALVAALLNALGWPINTVVPHKHWTGKGCPHLLLPRWTEFLAQIAAKLVWDPAAEIQRLWKDGIINTHKSPEAVVNWGELATVLNRIRHS